MFLIEPGNRAVRVPFGFLSALCVSMCCLKRAELKECRVDVDVAIYGCHKNGLYRSRPTVISCVYVVQCWAAHTRARILSHLNNVLLGCACKPHALGSFSAWYFVCCVCVCLRPITHVVRSACIFRRPGGALWQSRQRRRRQQRRHRGNEVGAANLKYCGARAV